MYEWIFTKKILVVYYYPMRFNLKSYEDLIMGWSRFIEFVREKMWMQFLVNFSMKGCNMHPLGINFELIKFLIATLVYIQYTRKIIEKNWDEFFNKL